MLVREIISAVFILSGVIFMVISAIGVITLPDFYTRNSASTKSISLGVALILIGAAVYYNTIPVLLQIVAILFFIALMTPLAAHIMGRTACKINIPFWERTNTKELQAYKEEQDRNEPDESTSKTQT